MEPARCAERRARRRSHGDSRLLIETPTGAGWLVRVADIPMRGLERTLTYEDVPPPCAKCVEAGRRKPTAANSTARHSNWPPDDDVVARVSHGRRGASPAPCTDSAARPAIKEGGGSISSSATASNRAVAHGALAVGCAISRPEQRTDVFGAHVVSAARPGSVGDLTSAEGRFGARAPRGLAFRSEMLSYYATPTYASPPYRRFAGS
jgi:hypothetical protein